MGFKKTAQQMKLLLFGVFLSHLGTYMVVPLMPIFLKLEKGMGISEIGMILALSPFTFQAGSLLGGWLADRIGRKSIIAIGAWFNAAAIAGFAFFDQFWLFVAMGLLSGFGVGLNAPSTKAALATLASQDGSNTTAFSLRGIAANIGTAIAGLLTYYILGGSSELIFYVSASLYILLGAVSWGMLPKGCGNAQCPILPARSYLSIFRNIPFIVFSLISIVIWALYTQLSISLPLRGENVLSDPGMVSLIWTINSLVVIFLQTPISRMILDKINPMFALSLGVLFVGGGLGSLYWVSGFYGLMVSGMIFIVGEMLIVPTLDATVSRMGTAQMIGAIFGISNFVSGLGEGAGKFAAGQLLDLGTSSPVPWWTYAVTALIIGMIAALLRFWKPMQNVFEKADTSARKSNIIKGNEGRGEYSSFFDWFLGRNRRAKIK